MDYPIKSYFTPSPTYTKSVEQTIAPWCEGWGECVYVNLWESWINTVMSQCYNSALFLGGIFFFGIKHLEGNLPQQEQNVHSNSCSSDYSSLLDSIQLCESACTIYEKIHKHCHSSFPQHTHAYTFSLRFQCPSGTLSTQFWMPFFQNPRKENYLYPFSTI